MINNFLTKSPLKDTVPHGFPYTRFRYQIVCPSLRDAFSASGKRNIAIAGNAYELSQVYSKLHLLSSKIKHYLENAEIDTLKKYWSKYKDTGSLKDSVTFWKEMADSMAYGLPDKLKASHIFEDGLINI